eukprot:CAMPEP_0172170674 /NCGR_PEP_ID=MMETSP1050-20130122/11411_1 /TAXON_ID=233186 /ORGANISM="Cryptomonas curvata, Strain CCAP979/52" /LENGTH=116 /DNA_ID=CAMNT_0012841907 /DNA_START=605 /DNA_END=955 /DNA_ORIENTATION=-
MVVANCHKQPQHMFQKVMVSIDEMILELRETLSSLFQLNPSVTVVVTVSPVRHWKDGSGECKAQYAPYRTSHLLRKPLSDGCELRAVENSLSKASLIIVAHELVKLFPKRQSLQSR